MKHRMLPLAASVAAAFGGIALAVTVVPGTALAQAQGIERIEVTGSLIRRIEGETALPVHTLSIGDLEKAGVTNAEQVVKWITQQQGGTVTSRSVSGTNGAAAYADLRSLGASRTLVLLNGKRVVSNPFSTVAVDLNTLPLAALERIETLSDGASSIYGTDAIAGVINFITKKDYQGGAVSVQAQVTEAGGGDVYTATLMGGVGSLGSQGWNLVGGFNIRQQDPMRGTEREFSRSSYQPDKGFNGLSPTTFPANYSQAGAAAGQPATVPNWNPSLPNCAPPLSLFAPEAVVGLGSNRCGADTQGFTNTVPIQDQWSLFLRGALALNKNHTASLEYFRSFNKVQTQIAPSPEGGLTLTPASPFYPGNGITPAYSGPGALDTTRNVSVSWRTTVLGPRQGVQENTTQRLVASLDGVVAGWDYQASLLWSNALVENTFLNGYPITTALRAGVTGTGGAPFLNPFGDQTAAGLAYMQANQVLGKVQEGESTLTSVSAVVSRQFGSLPGGPMSVALSAERRTEEMIYTTDIAKVSQASSSGLAGSGAERKGDRDITAFGVEFSFPIAKSLEFGLSGRYDDYSDFGTTKNPKATLKWTPMKSLLVRGSVNTGFAAPTLTGLYAPNSTTFTSTRYNDPVLCPGGVADLAAGAVASRDCGIQFQQLTGGNAALQPEKSDAFTIGFVAQPTAKLSVGLDYWNYVIRNSISTVGETAIFGDPVKYAGLFVRCSAADPARRALVPGCQTPGGDPLAYIINTNLNLGDVKTSGIDVQANWQGGATPYGRFSVGLRGSYVQKYQFQVEPGGRWFDPVANYNPQFGGPVIRYLQVTTLGWDMGPWSATLANRYQSSYRDQNLTPAPYNDRRVKHYTIFDLSVGYKGFKGWTLNGSILNLLDQDPPFTNQLSFFQARAYDDRFHNPLGRTYQVSARYEFK